MVANAVAALVSAGQGSAALKNPELAAVCTWGLCMLQHELPIECDTLTSTSMWYNRRPVPTAMSYCTTMPVHCCSRGRMARPPKCCRLHNVREFKRSLCGCSRLP